MQSITNRETGDFNIPTTILNGWISTRKSPRKLGDKFEHPRIFSTFGYKTDRNWFAFAIVIEIATILVSIFVIEFNFVYVSIALVVVAIDIICAIFLHKPQYNINKLKCYMALNDYKGKIEPAELIATTEISKGYKDELNKFERKKIFFVVIIILVAIVKSVGVIIALSDDTDDSALIPYIIPVLFGVTAYVHIKHTGYFLSEFLLRKSFFKERTKYYAEKANLEGDSREPENLIKVEMRGKLQNIPLSIKNDLDKIVQRIKDNNEKGRRFNERRGEPDESSDFITLYKYDNNNNIRIVYDDSKGSGVNGAKPDDSSQRYYLTSWGKILDENLFDLIDSTGMDSDLKSYIGYSGLKIQSEQFSSKQSKD